MVGRCLHTLVKTRAEQWITALLDMRRHVCSEPIGLQGLNRNYLVGVWEPFECDIGGLPESDTFH